MAAFPELEDPKYTSGGIPFEWDFDGYGENFVSRGTSSYIKARCAFTDSADFLSDMLGSSTGTNGQPRYDRLLPQPHPSVNNLWVTNCSLLSTPSSSLAGANQEDLDFGLFTADWCIYGVTFGRLPYDLLDDATVDSISLAPKEAARYCVSAFRPRAREFSVNSYALEVEADPTIPIGLPAFTMDKEMDLVVTQVQVPANLAPFTAINDCLGTINTDQVDLVVTLQNGTQSLVQFTQDQLLFRGLAQDLTRYAGPTGSAWYFDLPFVFGFRPDGWRKLPNPSGTGAQVTVRYKGISPTKYLYTRSTFGNLFKPAS